MWFNCEAHRKANLENTTTLETQWHKIFTVQHPIKLKYMSGNVNMGPIHMKVI